MTPWMSHQEIQTILKYLNKSATMLEYGCGGSTNFFCDYVETYYSVEHDRQWFEKVSQVKKQNVNMFHTPRTHVTPDHQRKVASSVEDLDNAELSSRYKDFFDYITTPESFQVKFDAVLIDGRARPECAKFIANHLKEKAYVFVHDYWNRKPYHLIEEMYTLVDSVKSGQSLAVFQSLNM